MLRESFLHYAGVGFAEPAADRYQVDYGGYAQLYADGQLWGGQARYTGEETLRGMPCRTAAVQAGSDAYPVWIDDEHVRQIQYERHGG